MSEDAVEKPDIELVVSAISATHAIPRLLGDASGYLLSGGRREGFDDRPELSDEQRTLIARWALRYAPDSASDVQKRLVEEGASHEPDVELLAAAIRDAEEDLPRAEGLGLLRSVGERERERLSLLGYPLDADALAEAVGISVREVWAWESLGLIPSHGLRGSRYFFSAAAMQATALAQGRYLSG